MRPRSQRSSVGLAMLAAAGMFVTLALSGAPVRAQTPAGGPGGAPSTPADQNCAVSTARLGSLDVTEVFGIPGGAGGFAQAFSIPSSQAMPSTPAQALVQRCIRLEVENPAPGDLLPVGGYVMGGFAFDPTVDASQAPGISSVQVFLDDPNQGGTILGGVSGGAGSSGKGLGRASARGAAFGDQFATAGFRLTIQIPSAAAGSTHALFVVVLSSAGRVGTVALPVAVGNLTPAVPTRTP